MGWLAKMAGQGGWLGVKGEDFFFIFSSFEKLSYEKPAVLADWLVAWLWPGRWAGWPSWLARVAGWV